MSELINKISSYNLFNYLLPGVLFAVMGGEIVGYSVLPMLKDNIVAGAFLCYFIGLVVSRFGSLVIEPLLKRLAFVKFSTYADFVGASKKDDQLAVLSEVNNTYRTLCSLFGLLLLIRPYMFLQERFPIVKEWNATALMALLFFMFLFSYRKQTTYISKRVKANS